MRGLHALSKHDFKSVTDTDIALLVKKYDNDQKGGLKFCRGFMIKGRLVKSIGSIIGLSVQFSQWTAFVRYHTLLQLFHVCSPLS